MMLTDAQKQQAKELGLTQEEARFSLATGISLVRYATVKAETQAERDAWDAKLEGMNTAMLERARYFAPYGRGERPWPEETDESPSEDGG
jgi:hypothetical protein